MKYISFRWKELKMKTAQLLNEQLPFTKLILPGVRIICKFNP
jgi:hypothetical protein